MGRPSPLYYNIRGCNDAKLKHNNPTMMTTTTSAWFTVDRVGLAKKLARKPKQFVVVELMQNAWDAPGVTEVIFDRFTPPF